MNTEQIIDFIKEDMISRALSEQEYYKVIRDARDSFKLYVGKQQIKFNAMKKELTVLTVKFHHSWDNANSIVNIVNEMEDIIADLKIVGPELKRHDEIIDYMESQ